MRKALCIGIDEYPTSPLHGCVNDAEAISNLLNRHFDSSTNFSIRSLLNQQATKRDVKKAIRELFSGDSEIALLYFSGHGSYMPSGSSIVTIDGSSGDEGISMSDILNDVNNSSAQNKIIIFDCCFSGDMGVAHNCASDNCSLAPGVTILSASRAKETSREINGHGVFTNLLCAALEGGAADLLGRVTPGSLYSYVDQALGAWDQRPVFKTNVSQFITVRRTNPQIKLEVLHHLTQYFPEPNKDHQLDPSYEETSSQGTQEHIAIFKDLQQMVKVGLVLPNNEEHMYYAAMRSQSCRLTPLGHHYWHLVNEQII